jgi:hypothetical protein
LYLRSSWQSPYIWTGTDNDGSASTVLRFASDPLSILRDVGLLVASMHSLFAGNSAIPSVDRIGIWARCRVVQTPFNDLFFFLKFNHGFEPTLTNRLIRGLSHRSGRLRLLASRTFIVSKCLLYKALEMTSLFFRLQVPCARTHLPHPFGGWPFLAFCCAINACGSHSGPRSSDWH